jgi:hypothetical protein
VLLDVLNNNIYLENLGTTINNIIVTSTNINFYNYNLNFNKIYEITSLLNIWPNYTQFTVGITQVFFSDYVSNSYSDTLMLLGKLSPYFFTLDYLHYYYVLQYLYKFTILYGIEPSLSIIKPLHYSLSLNILFSVFINKWGYALFTFTLLYFFSNIIKFRYQYGFNFYFSYFKKLADLGEQEYGSYDDYKFFLFFLVQMFIWYCWVIFIGYTFSMQSESRLMLLTLSVMVTIISIPVRLLWDFGLSFGMYLRGAASSSNLVVEAFFDIIGVIIIFTRFVVQNIRFLLVFVAFFELFEWAATNSEINYFLSVFTPFTYFNNNLNIVESTNLFVLFLNFFKVSFIYLYHLLHLIIVSFMQIGVYFMVSFWLFFFLYTSFFKLTIDNYFSLKRNI